MPNYKLVLSYDGSRYRGWQKQGNTEKTIQAFMEKTLSNLTGEAIDLNASGRTDAGVHALKQVCSFRTQAATDADCLREKLCDAMPADIGILELSPAQPRFHARLSCKKKTYLYRIRTGSRPAVFDRNYYARIENSLDTEAMKQASVLMLGTHDFSAFHSGHLSKSAVRTIFSIDFRQDGDLLEIEYTGDGFLYNMVRILTGTLIEVGLHQRNPESVTAALETGDRSLAGYTAPAKGLFLKDVFY